MAQLNDLIVTGAARFLNTINGKITNASTADNGISTITRSGTNFTVTRADGSTTSFTQQDSNTTYAVVSTSVNGLAPKITSTSGFLKGDGTWATPTNTTYANMTSAAAGLAPAGGSGTTKYLRQDGSWQVPPDNNTTYGNVSTAAAGLAPKVTSTSAYLRGDGTWATPTNTTYANMTSAAAGLAPAGGSGTTKYLRQDGSWQVPPDNNTTYGNFTSAAAGLVPAPASSTSRFLKGDGTWATPTNTTYAIKATNNSNAGVDISQNTIGYISGLTTATWNYGHSDGAIYGQWYSAAWKHEIYGDYRTGQLSIRGMNNSTWQNWRRVLDETNCKTIIGNMTSGVAGLAPAGGSGTTKYLRQDGSWQVPPNTTYAVATTAANGLMASGDKTNLNSAIKNITRSGVTFTATKVDGGTFTFTQQDSNTTYGNMTSAAAGLAPAGGSGTTKYLRQDGSWQVPPNTTYGNMTSAVAGLAPAGGSGTTKYLRQDGSWQVPPDNNTTYTGANGISLSGNTFSNSGVRSIATGGSNGTINVNTNGTTANVAVKGLAALAYKASLSKSDVGLGNVNNTADANKTVNTATYAHRPSTSADFDFGELTANGETYTT